MMKGNFDVSIIVPVHNAKNTVCRAVESLLKLKDINAEILLIENGSTDDSFKVITEYARNYDNVVALTSKEANVSKARNVGLKNANGKYIGFVDSDDYVEPKMYHKLYELAERKGSDIVFAEYFRDCYRNGNSECIEVTEDLLHAGSQSMHFLNLLAGTLYSGEPVIMASVWRGIYKKDFLMENHILFWENMAIGEDLIFNLDVLRQTNKLEFCHVPLYHYVQSTSSASNAFRDDMWERYRIFFHCLRDYGRKYFLGDEFERRVTAKIVGLSGWIIGVYARSSTSFAYRAGKLKLIREELEELLDENETFKSNYMVSAVIKRRYLWLILRGEAARMKRKIRGANA